MIKNSGFILFWLCSFNALAQNISGEIGVILDNDLYTSTVNDKYYTNGFEVYYRYLNPTKNDRLVKKITEFRLGQYIYNPQTIKANDVFKIDRPFAGVLFAEAGLHQFCERSCFEIKWSTGFYWAKCVWRRSADQIS